MVYIEFGLSIPRYTGEDGNKKAIPRSGGEKNYVGILGNKPYTVADNYFSWSTSTVLQSISLLASTVCCLSSSAIRPGTQYRFPSTY